MSLAPLIACNIIATFIALMAIMCNVVGMSFHFSPDGPLGWLSEGLIGTAIVVYAFGLTTPL